MSNEEIQIAVHLSPASQYMQKPSDLQKRHALIQYRGQVGQLQDVHLVSVARSEWEAYQQQILAAIQSAPGVTRVEVQQKKQRAKRVMDEY
ncbi:hypothetical protein DL93DRAFT_2053779 [Clavulina sp. PMI_390]|nr:hypothetical protein DL93DRAFT_2053779 [Clavulina sp. PMI_390]